MNIADDLSLVAFDNVDINLFDLYAAHQGQGAVIGRTFTGCRLQGPAIVLVSGGTSFEDTNFGDPRGEMRNLLLQPMGSKALGTVPMVDCKFIGCEFYNVGFTGSADILELLAAVPSLPGAPA
jgi:hypothetical protein